MSPLSVHLIDGTYELFRQFHGRKRFEKPGAPPFGAVAGVLHSILEMIEKGATHVGVATTMSSNRFATGFGPATRRASASSARCGPSSIRWRRHFAPWA